MRHHLLIEEITQNLSAIENVMLFYPGGIPVAGLKKYERGEHPDIQKIRGKLDGAIYTNCLAPEQFRKMARTMLRTGQAEMVDGLFKLILIK